MCVIVTNQLVQASSEDFLFVALSSMVLWRMDKFKRNYQKQSDVPRLSPPDIWYRYISVDRKLISAHEKHVSVWTQKATAALFFVVSRILSFVVLF